MLGMQERQTQIWFQNRCVRVNRDDVLSTVTEELVCCRRRAKAKLQESRKEHAESDIPPELVPTLSAGSDAELYYLVHEDERKPSMTTLPAA